MASVKDRVLAQLEAHRGSYLSGEELAGELGVTRAAVWKAINALRAAGCPIDAAPNRGYALGSSADLLTAASVSARLTGPAASLHPVVYDSVPSTNRTARELAQNGEPAGTVVIAAAQTEGRGRAGHSFYSPAGTGLYMSLLLRPDYSAADATLLTAAAAAAVADAVESLCGRPCGIKWVNDVLLDGKKICGILTEAAVSLESGGLDYVVVGIGVNVAPPPEGFPPELADVAGAVFPSAEAAVGMRARLAAAILNRLWPDCRDPSARRFLPGYRSRLYFLGRQVTVLQNGRQWQATAEDVDEHCRLLLRNPDGTRAALTGGEIRILP
ncbi:MAG: biotin--[acetyl-CoA-carboxylase] ligase [Gemmiger sp.]